MEVKKRSRQVGVNQGRFCPPCKVQWCLLSQQKIKGLGLNFSPLSETLGHSAATVKPSVAHARRDAVVLNYSS